ncbi:hypothetical protein OSB04_016371 [Centaurea solstitialis]|uniref:F-box domain-containing protein n=1 Tax=Centaurea solstitialis TaxID=347529 RepID=A0AA38TBW3_9ASTR|nr:hypothetical protein OSB04_016371 [Centaurea solstitialis]
MEELPTELTIDILSRLPFKTIIQCKRVCKIWRNLVLDSSFVNLHLSRSPTGLVIHEIANDQHLDPGILNWVETHLHHDPLMSLDLNMVPFLKSSIIDQMGSANGLIFLSQNSQYRIDDAHICNPVTREIMILPSPRYHTRGSATVVYGFGVGSLTGEYKLVRIFHGKIPLNGNESGEYKTVLEAEVYTLGTGQWRSVGRVPYRLDGSNFGVVLNDHCHWNVFEEGAPENICTFDLNKETFQLFPSPPPEVIEESFFEKLVVLNGCLCKSYAYNYQLTIWVMKEYGVKKSWHKEVVITEAISGGLDWPLEDSISLIHGLNDGSILIFSAELLVPYRRGVAQVAKGLGLVDGIHWSQVQTMGVALWRYPDFGPAFESVRACQSMGMRARP